MPLTLPHTLTAGTNENVTDVQNNFNEVANAFPVQAANIGDSQVTTAKIATGAITPHKYLTVVHKAAATSHTFSGLSGDAAYAYEIEIIGSFSGTPSANPILAPNGTTTGQHSGYHSADFVGSNEVANAASTGMNFLRWFTAPYVVNAKMRLMAKTGVGSYRILTSNGITTRNSDGFTHSFQYAATWAEVATNITSIVFTFGGTFTGMLTLRKLGEV